MRRCSHIWRHRVDKPRQAGRDLVFVAERIEPYLCHGEASPGPRPSPASLRRLFPVRSLRCRTGAAAPCSCLPSRRRSCAMAAFMSFNRRCACARSVASKRTSRIPIAICRSSSRSSAWRVARSSAFPSRASWVSSTLAPAARTCSSARSRRHCSVSRAAPPAASRASFARRNASSARFSSACARSSSPSRWRIAAFGRRYVLLESRGIVAPFVDQQDRIGWGLAGAGPRAFRGFGVGPRLAQPRELALGVHAPVVQVRERNQQVALGGRLGTGDALGRRRERPIAVGAEVGDQLVDARSRCRRVRLCGSGLVGASRRRCRVVRALLDERRQSRDLCRGRQCHAEEQRGGDAQAKRSGSVWCVHGHSFFRTSRADCATWECYSCRRASIGSS